jgi:hypothetical protein
LLQTSLLASAMLGEVAIFSSHKARRNTLYTKHAGSMRATTKHRSISPTWGKTIVIKEIKTNQWTKGIQLPETNHEQSQETCTITRDTENSCNITHGSSHSLAIEGGAHKTNNRNNIFFYLALFYIFCFFILFLVSRFCALVYFEEKFIMCIEIGMMFCHNRRHT